MTQQSEPRRGFFSRAWQGIKGLAVMISAISAAIAAGYARDTACSIAEAEKLRIAMDRMKFSHATYRDFIKTRTSGDSPTLKRPRFRCWVFLASPQIADNELTSLLSFYSDFKYEARRHAPMREFCLEGDERTQEWSDTDAGMVSNRVINAVFSLDEALIAYRQPIGDPKVVCENFAGFFTSGVALEDYRYGALGKFVDRMIALKALREENFPNLKHFAEHLSKHTDGFTKQHDCSQMILAARDPCEEGVAAWLKSATNWVVGQTVTLFSFSR